MLYPRTKDGVIPAAGMNRVVGDNLSVTMTLTLKSFTADTLKGWGAELQ